MKRQLTTVSGRNQAKYEILEPILQLLLQSGNDLATSYRWGSNPTGYFCLLKDPIDFDLIEQHFVVPSSVALNRQYGEVDFGLGTAVIRTA